MLNITNPNTINYVKYYKSYAQINGNETNNLNPYFFQNLDDDLKGQRRKVNLNKII